MRGAGRRRWLDAGDLRSLWPAQRERSIGADPRARSHAVEQGPGPSRVRSMTGGLDEPEELAVEQGSLALLLDGDEHTRAQWEACCRRRAAQGRAAGRRRPRRGGVGQAHPADPGRHRGHPARHAGPPRGSGRRGTPQPGRSLGRAGRGRGPRPEGAERRRPWPSWRRARARCGCAPPTTCRRCSTACCSTWRPSSSTCATTTSERRGGWSTTSPTRPPPPARTSAFPPRRTTSPWSRPRGWRPGPRCSASSSTRPTLHDRGASDVQELAWSLTAAVRVLRVLEAAGHRGGSSRRHCSSSATPPRTSSSPPSPSSGRPGCCGPASLDVCEAEPVEQRQHAVTSRPMLSAYDPWVNLLRTTVAAFAAGVGGAEAITVVPFDSPLGRSDTLRPPPRSQHLRGPARRGPPRPGRRPRRRRVRRRAAHPRPRRRRLAALRRARRRSRSRCPARRAGRRDRELSVITRWRPGAVR